MRHWKFPQSNPVVRPGALHPAFDQMHAGAAHVIRVNDHYRMAYWGRASNGKYYILQAETPVNEPNAWQPVGDPTLGPQLDSGYNWRGPVMPFVLPVSETFWLLYFVGWGQDRADGQVPNRTGVAISENGGLSWRYIQENPILPMDRAYDVEATGSVWVLREGSKFRMYYTAIGKYFECPKHVKTGHGNRIPEIGIAYAESSDGIHWEKPIEHLLVAPRNSR